MAVRVEGPKVGGAEEVLTAAALNFLADLHRRFEPARRGLMRRREERQEELSRGVLPTLAPAPEGAWQVGEIPHDLRDRRVEITGPADPKMIINALNSGANVYMADFEDALSPTWENLIGGQRALIQAVRGTLRYQAPDGREYRIGERPATLVVRPRGWHLEEPHLWVEGEPMAGALVDFGLYLFHNHQALSARGSGPYFYLPKLESAEEAKLWEEVFSYSEEALGLSRGTIKATVLIETILAAFEMDAILAALRPHVVGLNAGRWDYLFSIIKKFRHRPELLPADRQQIGMTVPFMRAYTELLVQTCHRRGAYAIGGMAAFIPNRRDPEVTRIALEKVREDKRREAQDGFDGTWVAHPDLVPVAKAAFDAVLGTRSDQRERRREEVVVSAQDLLHFVVPGGRRSREGLEHNVAVAVQYLAHWLAGSGAVALYHLMEDAATAEIARAQVWHWLHHQVRLDDGTRVDRALVEDALERGVRQWGGGLPRLNEAIEVFREVALSPRWVDFVTQAAYPRLLTVQA